MYESGSRLLSKMGRELCQVAKELDGNGWAMVSVALVICGWFFLKGNKVKV